MQKIKFLVDENLGIALAKWLQQNNFDVIAVITDMRGAADDEVLNKAFKENRILITSDKDFGEKVFSKKMQHCGIILMRLQLNTKENAIKVLENLLQNHLDDLIYNYVIVTETKLKIIKQSTF